MASHGVSAKTSTIPRVGWGHQWHTIRAQSGSYSSVASTIVLAPSTPRGHGMARGGRNCTRHRARLPAIRQLWLPRWPRGTSCSLAATQVALLIPIPGSRYVLTEYRPILSTVHPDAVALQSPQMRHPLKSFSLGDYIKT